MCANLHHIETSQTSLFQTGSGEGSMGSQGSYLYLRAMSASRPCNLLALCLSFEKQIAAAAPGNQDLAGNASQW